MTQYVVVYNAVNVFDPSVDRREAEARKRVLRLRQGQTVDASVLVNTDIGRLLDLGAIREASSADLDASEEPVDDSKLEEPPIYSEVAYPELQKLAKDRGLSAGGSATEIAARLVEQDAENKRLADMQGS